MDRKIKRQINAYMQNAILIIAIYIGAWYNVDWLSWAVVAFVWFMLVMYFAVLYSEGGVKNSTNVLPLPVVIFVDVTCIAMLVYAKWHLTATAYAMSAIVLQKIYYNKSKKAEELN
jgi:hypothetical protein